MDYRSRLLIVDDDIEILEQLEQILKEDYVVSLATSGTQALQYLQSDHWVDIILLDVLMPGCNGYETLDAIRTIPGHRKTPVIFLTSLRDPESEVRGLQMDADYITKPCAPIVLLSRVERNLRMVGCLDWKKLESLPQSLSTMEYRAAVLMARGCSNEEIAQHLSYTLGSVKNILMRVMGKLSISSRKEIELYKR